MTERMHNPKPGARRARAPGARRGQKRKPRLYHPRPADHRRGDAARGDRQPAEEGPGAGREIDRDRGGPPPLRRREPGFAGLAAIVVSQQVSVASATAIFGRLEQRIAPLEAAGITSASEETLRACGLSGAKFGRCAPSPTPSRAIRSISAAWRELTRRKRIARWLR